MIRRLLAASAVLGLGCMARAEVKTSPLFSDNMVLQQEMADPVWGTADPAEKVTVSINGQTKAATADDKGTWSLKLDPIKAGGPYELTIGGKTVKNVLVGEVWHASGQSNMHYTMGAAVGFKENPKESKPITDSKDAATLAEYQSAQKLNQKAVEEAQAAVAKADNPKLRFYENGHWTVSTARSAGQFTAVGFYFANDLFEQTKAPVGIINTSVSGAVAQAFMSPEAFDTDLKAMVAKHKADQTPSEFWPTLSDVLKFGIKGAIWYQGEGNRDFPQTYAKMFPALIADWRKQAGEGDFPFLFVQLANYGARKTNYTEGKDCGLREAQAKTLSVANTAMAVSIDCGFSWNVHYPEKKLVGDRLALAARALAYGEKLEYSGPMFDKATFEGGKATVSFTHLGGGLVAKSKEGAMSPTEKVIGFVLAGADKAWHRAEGKIEGDHVIVESSEVPQPQLIRYAFEKNPDCNLYNKEGLPAAPFRSDNWVNFSTKDGE